LIILDTEKISDTDMWQVFAKGIAGKTHTIDCEKKENTTLKEFANLISNKSGIPPDELRIIYKTKQIDHESRPTLTLKDYNIRSGDTFHLSIRLLGGASALPKLEWTDSECIIGLGDEGVKNIKMPCKHAISKDGLKSLIDSEFSIGKHQILCPGATSDKTDSDSICLKIYPWRIIEDGLAWGLEEKKEMHTKIATNFLKDNFIVRECPKCKSVGTANNIATTRVRCGACKYLSKITFEFCMSCGKEWKSKSNDDCGNSNCVHWIKQAMDQLIGVPKKTIQVGDTKVTNVPGRVCPREACYQKFGPTLVEHKSQCKHLTCPSCKKQFCVICLAQKGSSWPCGSYSAVCSLAPLQKFENLSLS